MNHLVYSSADQGRVGRIVPDLLRYRGLLRDLVSKELRARYRNAMIGFLWAVLHPLLMTLILTFVFSVVVRFEHDGRPAALYILSGLIFWQFLAAGIGEATRSLIDSQELVKKVHFPRETIPLAAILNCLVNLAIGLAVYVAVFLVLAREIPWGLAYIPLVFAIQFVLVIGVSLLTASANVYYHDVIYLTEVVLTFGFYASPILYPLEMVQQRLGIDSLAYRIYTLNPMVGLLTGYREALLDGQFPGLMPLLWPVACAGFFLIVGVVVFRRCSPVFADHL